MNDLDQPAIYNRVDKAEMHLRLAGLPDQVGSAYHSARLFASTLGEYSIQRIIIAAMGGSAIGAAFAQATCLSVASAPIIVWRNYDLPAYATGPDTLVIASSKSGDTEETLSACETAMTRQCRVIALTTGGRLAELARDRQVPCFRFVAEHTPREAVAWLSLPVIAILAALKVIPDPANDVDETVAVLRDGARKLGIDSPTARNPAKRMAGQVVQRLPIIYGSGLLAPVAQRWKSVLNENAKMLAACDEMPELDHNTIVGYEHDDQIWRRSIVIQLRCNADHPRVAARYDLTTRLMLEAGINQDTIRARGGSALAQLFSLVQYGDWVSYYAAVMSDIDPTPTAVLDRLKQEMDA
ncbi:MAG: bifunctional phosphoglucose/phosphomannose isomerase [Chloroflexi bacterium]|nr:bifunctional phosphoglucose/phosphomannose isomerase [Chloroflexota bacterium]MCL5275930.1 bifunctional phosphoglucose/phosphomannose isomerase [Chloroflexota bacterium]